MAIVQFANLFRTTLHPKAKYFFHFFFQKHAKVHPKMCLSESLSFFFSDDGILLPLYCGREKKEVFVMLANQRRCDT